MRLCIQFCSSWQGFNWIKSVARSLCDSWALCDNSCKQLYISFWHSIFVSSLQRWSFFAFC